MLYVWQAAWRPGLSRDERDGALARRASWDYPAGVEVHGEYWLADDDPAVIVIFEADSFEPVLELGFTWGDVFSITCTPACRPEQGLRWGGEILQRRG